MDAEKSLLLREMTNALSALRAIGSAEYDCPIEGVRRYAKEQADKIEAKFLDFVMQREAANDRPTD